MGETEYVKWRLVDGKECHSLFHRARKKFFIQNVLPLENITGNRIFSSDLSFGRSYFPIPFVRFPG
jgi:hypothetical protein